MSPARVTRALAWLTGALVAADVAVSAQAIRLTSETAVAVHGFPFIDGAVLGSAVLGALIVARYDRHPIGWLLSVVGVVGAVSLVTEAYAFWVQEDDGPGPALLGDVAAWVSTLFGGQVVIGGLALMFLLAPDGHLPSRRWRYAVGVTVSGMLLCVVAVLSTPPAGYRLTTSEDEIGLVRQLALTLGFLAILGGLVSAVVSVLLRLRRSQGEQRLQLRLIALAAALPTFGVLCLLVVQALNGDQQTYAAALPLFTSYFLLPILFAVAALRHRLYDLDVIVNRAVVVVAGVAFAAVGYSALVVASGRVLEGTGGGFWISLLGTAVVALAFQPLRRGVVRLADRLAYGRRAQPYEALADFSRRLATAPPPGTLLPAVAESAGRAVPAEGAVASFDVPGDEPLRGTWGEPGPADHVVPVRLDDRVLGTIEVTLARGRTLGDADRALLDAVAQQAAMAFRNTALASELAAHVDDLERTTRELAESRLRLVEADDAARRGLESAIARDVLPLIADLPSRIGRVREAVAAGGPAAVDPLVADTNAALESLRDLSRGVFPSQLARSGLEPALRSLLARAGSTPALALDGVAGHRFGARVEAALYFCCAEAIRPGGRIDGIRLALDHDVVRLALDGVDPGTLDLRAITDRIGAAGGTVATDGGTLVVSVPVSPPAVERSAGTRPRG